MVGFAAMVPSLTAASSLDVERHLVASALAVAAVDDDLDASNTSEAHRQIFVKRDLLLRDDDEEHRGH